jgi:predicted metal-dependent RNase
LQLFYANAGNIKNSSSTWAYLNEYARNIVAQGEIEHQTAGLFEPEG